MEFIILLFILIIVLEIALALKPRKRKKRQSLFDLIYPKKNIVEDNKELDLYNLPYERKLLLTRNEYYFYQKLKNIAGTYNYQILAKIRLADLLDVRKGLSNKEWNSYFSRIKSKHIDFALVNDMNIVLLIELDDSTHNQRDRKERDLFVNAALSQAGYKVIHTYGDTLEIENYITNSNYNM